jgi:enediyne biosynthesis protein E4
MEARSYRQTMARVEEEIENGLVSRAAKDLGELLAANPRSDEVAFLMGSCEKARGRATAADNAWASIPPDSAFAFHALEGRVELELEQGRLSAAEQLVFGALQSPRFAGPDPRILLGAIYSREGRLTDAMRLIETLWQHHIESGEAASESAINQLRLYIELRSNPVPAETIRAILEQAGELAPDDDRIWLWRANLAIRSARYDEAASWLDRCQRRRPEDATVWRARLDWAVATNHVPTAREAMKHLPSAESTPKQVQKLAAWFAAQSGDDAAERTSLQLLIAIDPTDFAALDRLIALLAKSGQTDEANALRHRKDEIERVQARYQKLFKRHQPRRDAAEMGRLAHHLGRRFEAKAFLTIAVAAVPDRADLRSDLARLAQSDDPATDPARTLYDLVAPDALRPATRKTPGSQ